MTANEMVDIIDDIPANIQDAETGEAAKASNKEAKRALRMAKEMWINTTQSVHMAEEIFNNTVWENETWADKAKEEIMAMKGMASEAKEAWADKAKEEIMAMKGMA